LETNRDALSDVIIEIVDIAIAPSPPRRRRRLKITLPVLFLRWRSSSG
jgi:hypothetical protein